MTHSLLKPIVLQAKNLSKQITTISEQITILSSVNLTVHAQETIAIRGASGSGKSTLLSLLAGLDKPTGGEVFLANQCVSELSEDACAKIRKQFIGFVFQSFQLLSSLTALENVLLATEICQRQNPLQLAKNALASVGLEHRFHHYPQQLSGGEQQRVAIARAFAPAPKILFADEPTGNLDQATGSNIIDLLFSLNTQHATTLVLVTHDQSLANRCQRHFLIEHGRCYEP
jgi:putative ABC transport system ATP-binding protein